LIDTVNTLSGMETWVACAIVLAKVLTEVTIGRVIETGAIERVDKVGAEAAVPAWVTRTLVDVDFAENAGVSRQAVAAKTINTISAVAAVLAGQTRTLVYISFTD
jgi:hypothetical protein